MGNFIIWVFSQFYSVINTLTTETVNLINIVFGGSLLGDNVLSDIPFNLSLFSDTPILTTNVYDFLLLVFSVLYTVIFVVIVYKIIKKVIVKVTRWNRW